MKYRYSKLDLLVLTPELDEKCKGLRVSNIYNVNNKTYLLKLTKQSNDDEKLEDEAKNKNYLLIESGTRIHLTDYEWPKENIPNSFAMKLRKHIKNKRIEYIKQLGVDRILDIQFGINDAAYHIIVELYDRGNIIITDRKYIILNVLRPRQEGENEDVKFIVKERYPIEKFQNSKTEVLNKTQIKEIIDNAKPDDNLKKLFLNYFYGPSLLEHCFIENNLNPTLKITQDKSIDLDKLLNSFKTFESVLNKSIHDKQGFIIQKEEDIVLNDENTKKIISFIDYSPINYNHYENLHEKGQKIVKYDSFVEAIDIYFSNIEAQKIDQRIYQKEKDAFKKIDNIKKDHEKRLQTLEEKQKQDQHKAFLIEANTELVEKALFILRSALSRQMSWLDIKQMLKEAQDAGDLVANRICSLKFDTNEFTILLDDPYEQKIQQQNDNVENNEQQQKLINKNQKKTNKQKSNQTKVDISLDLSAHGNARKYFQEKKQAKIKEDKTLEASSKALKNAEAKKAKALKEVKIKSTIIKSRKILWFEKFFWFISSENYIVIGGRDAIQNELLVKRYLDKNDLYVHADLHGASSVVIKNMSSKKKIPAKTIEEAGCFAVCYSSAWQANTPVRAWYVNADQVSKTAPTGEYLTLGSFMIRGKKNYLPMTQLAMGFTFFFRLNEDSIENHINDRKVKYELEDEEETGVNLDNEDDLTSSSFPDTKIKLTNKDDSEDNHILEAMKPRIKKQKKIKKQDKKSISESNDNKEQNQQKSNDKQSKNNRKGKNKKNKKDDDWSDDEDKIKIKLEKKMQKDNRIMNLDEQVKVVSLNDYLDDEEEEIIDEEFIDNEEENNEEIIDDNQQIESKINNKDIENNEELKEESNTLNNENDESTDEEKDIIDHEEEDDEGNTIETNDEKRESEYLKLVNSLTGQPLPDDSLLYCIAVVAPYSAVNNCKYKVKLLPGTNKRGRSAKTALNLFLAQTKSNTNEKDLIKIMKDQEIARNFPSGIKLAAQNLQKIKRKK